MYVAMNRFDINHGFEQGFEDLWKSRESRLNGVEGYQSFKLLRSEPGEETTLFASFTLWESEAYFRAWTESENFRSAHANTSAPKGTYAGHPNLELFTVAISETNPKA